MNTSEAILNFLNEHIQNEGYPPSVREIGDAVGLKSTSTTQWHLKRLEKQGLIRREPVKSRSIHVIGPEMKMVLSEKVQMAMEQLTKASQETPYRNAADAYRDAAELVKAVLE